MGWFWRQISREDEGLLAAVLGHMAADFSILFAVYLDMYFEMNILALKLILAPIIIGSASLAGRKWGPAVSGWIVGMPLTSGPVIFFVALSHESAFAANAALGVLSGGLSLVAYA